MDMKVRCGRTGILIVLLVTVVTSREGRAGVVAYWGFDDRDLHVAREERGGKDGEILGNPKWVTGRIGRALELDGSGDYVRIKHDPVFDLRDAITIAAWVKTRRLKTTFATLVSKGDGTWRISRDGDGNTLHFAANKDGNLWVVRGNTNVNDGRWHHIAAAFDGAEACLYVDGELDGRLPATTPFNCDSFDVCIGENAERTGRYWKGIIDDVLILDHALSAEEVKNLHAQGAKALITAGLGTLSGAISDARRASAEQGTRREISFLEKELEDAKRSQPQDRSVVGSCYGMVMSELYFLLGQAQIKAGARRADVIQSHKSAVTASFGSRQYVPALLWLFRHVDAREYADAVRESVRGSGGQCANTRLVVPPFEASKNWAAFASFLEAAFPESSDTLALAGQIGQSLEGTLWAEAFTQYCRDRPRLKPDYISAQVKLAEQTMAHHDFTGAAEIYRMIIVECGDDVDATPYELKICECLVNEDAYHEAISRIARFVEERRSADSAAVRHAMLLKGRAHMQMGQMDQAMQIFSRLAAQGGAEDVAPEAGFLAGYCDLMQNDLDAARRALGAVVDKYPESSCAGKARLCLARIERMSQ
jgi:tetratricopeptide (TPR) repeat protein